MSASRPLTSHLRTRWAAVGAAIAITLGAGGGIGLVNAAVGSGERAVFIPIEPCRITDTRPATKVGPKASPVGPGETHTVAAHGTNGDCTIPTDAVALSTNVTALNATANTFLVFWGAGSQPTAANLNPRAGGPPTPNAVITPLDSSGAFNIFNKAGNVDVIIDVNGYYADHHHDDRYYTEAEVDAIVAELTGDNIVDRSLSLSDLGTPGLGGGERTTTTNGAITLPAGSCKAARTGNFGASAIGKMVIGTLADPDGNPVLPNTAAVIPSIVIGTTQGGAVPNVVVCNTGGGGTHTVPAGSVFTYRLIDG